MWTVYERPNDFPQGYVARRWVIAGGKATPTQTAFTASTLDEIRRNFAPWFTCLPREPSDDPVIVETWLE
jgi:hypothetical protein